MAVLVRKVGARHLELIEDAVQFALVAALGAWTESERPDEPSAWLHQVALHRLIQELRRESGRLQILNRHAADFERAGRAVEPYFAQEISDDLLRMLFVCCDEAIPPESQLVLALKTLCGFSSAEVALRLFTSESNVQKRLTRARERLRHAPELDPSSGLSELRARLPSVHAVLYQLFNEGYLSARASLSIRRELCDEAVRLMTLLAEHPAGAGPESAALLALMHLHAARLGSRTDATGGLLLLEEQDRSLWDGERIRLGLEWLDRSAVGSVFSRFHAEAGIAAEHCLAASFEQTRWQEIARSYAMLERIAPSPLHTLNRSIAVAEWQGPLAGLRLLQELSPPSWLADSYLWDAVMADLHRRAGHSEIARQHRDRALDSAPTEALRALLARRLSSL